MIPTAIKRYSVIREVFSQTFSLPFNVDNKETVRLYGCPQIAIRWSPISVAIARLFRRLK